MGPATSAAIDTPPRERLDALAVGLAPGERERLQRAFEFALPVYEGKLLGTGEPALDHAVGMAQSAASLRLDADTRIAGLLFAVPTYLPDGSGGAEKLGEAFGAGVAALVSGITRLNQLRVVTRAVSAEAPSAARKSQAEVLRKMLLAMVEDIRVVLLRLASRTQTLRFLTRAPGELSREVAQETLDIYAPLANRLGVWQLKWELEDISFRFLQPELYKRIARMLDERRVEREAFIAEARQALGRELALVGIRAEVSGRPKHIYSIWSKMRLKSLDFDEVYDVRALRVLVDEVKDCYTVLGIVHDLWQPIPREFDDYISRPKGNFYRSLHTAVVGPDGQALEVQIRTHEMHRHAELGVAAHWRYKEGGTVGRDREVAGVPGRPALVARPDPFDEKIAFLRQVLAWRDDIVDSADWVEQFKHAALDDTVYVLTPQGKVIDLPQGATAIDFAYALHTDLGHRCRGARVNGAMVPLDYRLRNGERVEIIAAKTGGPSRDWLNPSLGYLSSSRAKSKVRQWFNNLELAQTLAAGRAIVDRELHREGRADLGLDALAGKFGFGKSDDFFAAVGREEIGIRQLQAALRGTQEAPLPPPELQMRQARAGKGGGGILIVGVDRLLTQLARCCKPAPPDSITGFVTRGRGVSIHRSACASLARLSQRHPERVISAQWGQQEGAVFSVDIVIRAADRQNLQREVSEVLAREAINVTAVATQAKNDGLTLSLTVEVNDLQHLRKALMLIQDVNGVMEVGRR